MKRLAITLMLFTTAVGATPRALPPMTAVDAEVERGMHATGAKGLAIAVIDNGRVVHVAAQGVRNAKGDPLEADTIMYGASLTKAAFAYAVMQLVEEGHIDLDRPIADMLPKPLPEYPTEEKYAPWADLAADSRWRLITPRMALTHSTGFANFAFLEPDEKLHIHFEPGTRFAYSGEGMILLQFAIERGLGRDVGVEMQRLVFDPLEMRHTSMMWRSDFAANLADGWALDGHTEPHDQRSKVRAAGSMDTSISDMGKLAAALVRGTALKPQTAQTMLRGQLPITTASQFPTLQPELPPAQRPRDLAAGLGVISFKGPQGPAFLKGGHDDITGNMMVCVRKGRRCVVLLSNDVRAEAAFPHLVAFVLGETNAPWRWEYGDMKFWNGAVDTPTPGEK